MSKLLTLGILQQVQNSQGGDEWTLDFDDMYGVGNEPYYYSNAEIIPENCDLWCEVEYLSGDPVSLVIWYKNGEQIGSINALNPASYLEDDEIQIRVPGGDGGDVTGNIVIKLDDTDGRVVGGFYFENDDAPKSRCFFITTKILTDIGETLAKDIKIGDSVLTYNHKLGTAKVIDIQHWKDVKTIVVKINELEISPDHPVMTNSGWKQAILVKTGDMLINEQGNFDIVGSVEHFNDVRDYIDFQVDREHAYFADGYLITAPRAAFYFDSIKAENESGQLFGVYKERGNHNSELLELRDSADKSGVCYLKTKPAKQYVIQGYKSDKCYFQSIGFIADGNFIEHSKDVVLIEQEKLKIDLDLSNYKNVEFVITGYFDPLYASKL